MQPRVRLSRKDTNFAQSGRDVVYFASNVPAQPRDGSRGRHQGAQAELAHQLRQAYALSAGFLLQRFEIFFGEAHQDLTGQLSLLAVAHVFLRHLGGRQPHLVVMPLVYDILAVK